MAVGAVACQRCSQRASARGLAGTPPATMNSCEHAADYLEEIGRALHVREAADGEQRARTGHCVVVRGRHAGGRAIVDPVPRDAQARGQIRDDPQQRAGGGARRRDHAVGGSQGGFLSGQAERALTRAAQLVHPLLHHVHALHRRHAEVVAQRRGEIPEHAVMDVEKRRPLGAREGAHRIG